MTSQRPSSLLGIVENGWIAYTFDRAVWRFGQEVENLCNLRNKDGKATYTLDEALKMACSGEINSEGKRYGSIDQLLTLGGGAVEIKD